jgi:hypothetical protein
MREGGYVRYDGRKSTQVVRDCDTLTARYGGKLRRLHEEAACDLGSKPGLPQLASFASYRPFMR